MKSGTLILLALLAAGSCAAAAPPTPVERSWAVLQSGATDQDSERRVKAVDALGLLVKDDRARQIAEAALSDPDPEVRAQAATSLGEIGLPAAVPKLKHAVEDTESVVVFSAAHALYMMKESAAYNVYYAVLTGEKKTGDTLLESQMKMLKDPNALARTGFEVGVGFIPYGGMGFKAIKSLRQDNVTPIRAAAAQKLAHDPDPGSAEALVKASSDEKWLVRASAISAIAQREDASLLSSVIPKLDDPEDGVRFNAAAAIVRLSLHEQHHR